LARLDQADLEQTLVKERPQLSNRTQLEAVMARRDTIVEFFDNEVKLRAETAVLLGSLLWLADRSSPWSSTGSRICAGACGSRLTAAARRAHLVGQASADGWDRPCQRLGPVPRVTVEQSLAETSA